MRPVLLLSLLLAAGLAGYVSRDQEFQFAILGDRTGSAVPGVYEQAWRETAADHPRFVITVGDTIEGGNDLTADSEWQQILKTLAVYQQYRIFFTPGNHDVWSVASAQAFEKYTKRPLHYSFDYGQAHFTILDNSRSDDLPAEERAFLQKDLQRHAGQSVKFVFSHRPSWIVPAVLRNPDFPLQRIAERYGVHYIVAGHLHQMLHAEVNGVTYLSIASSGGHLRGSKRYKDGWFFQHTLVTVRNDSADFTIKELGPPFGSRRVTAATDWGVAGLAASAQN
jgi:3',5'-cyclic-AMP phosphodiesterase